MCLKLLLDILIAVGTVGAVIAAMIAIYRSDKNSRQQILVNKLEELYEAIQSLSGYYPILEMLHYNIAVLRKKEKSPFDWLPEYYARRDSLLSAVDTKLIKSHLSRIAILTSLYTSGELQTSLLQYWDILYWFSDLVIDGSSMRSVFVIKKEFPKQPEFIDLVEKLKDAILNEIKH